MSIKQEQHWAPDLDYESEFETTGGWERLRCFPLLAGGIVSFVYRKSSEPEVDAVVAVTNFGKRCQLNLPFGIAGFDLGLHGDGVEAGVWFFYRELMPRTMSLSSATKRGCLGWKSLLLIFSYNSFVLDWTLPLGLASIIFKTFRGILSKKLPRAEFNESDHGVFFRAI
ncbi:hypothetical protein Tco_0608867 [Tanacetum coccineum]